MDPFLSMNPRMMVNEIIQGGMIVLGIEKDARRRESRVDAVKRILVQADIVAVTTGY